MVDLKGLGNQRLLTAHEVRPPSVSRYPTTLRTYGDCLGRSTVRDAIAFQTAIWSSC